MRVFDRTGIAKDGSGITVDIPRMWALVRDLVTAQEATVQYIFMYQPIIEKVVDYAKSIKEPDVLVIRAIRAMKQPGDSAPHNDHIHVRIYCSPTDRAFGCVDIGGMEMLAEREAETKQMVEAIAMAMPQHEPIVQEAVAITAPGQMAPTSPTVPTPVYPDPAAIPVDSATAVWQASAASSSLASTTASSTESLNSLFRARTDRIDLRSWR